MTTLSELPTILDEVLGIKRLIWLQDEQAELRRTWVIGEGPDEDIARVRNRLDRVEALLHRMHERDIIAVCGSTNREAPDQMAQSWLSSLAGRPRPDLES